MICKKYSDFALANPPRNCTNKEDWTVMCNLFKTEEFQTKSDDASKARKSQVLRHSNGPKSFAQSRRDRVYIYLSPPNVYIPIIRIMCFIGVCGEKRIED